MKCCGHFPLQLGKVGNKMTDKSLKENNYNEEHTIGRNEMDSLLFIRLYFLQCDRAFTL